MQMYGGMDMKRTRLFAVALSTVAFLSTAPTQAHAQDLSNDVHVTPCGNYLMAGTVEFVDPIGFGYVFIKLDNGDSTLFHGYYYSPKSYSFASEFYAGERVKAIMYTNETPGTDDDTVWMLKDGSLSDYSVMVNADIDYFELENYYGTR